MSVTIDKDGEVTLSSNVVKYHGLKGIRQFVDEATWATEYDDVPEAEPEDEEKDDGKKKAKDFSMKPKVKTVYL